MTSSEIHFILCPPYSNWKIKMAFESTDRTKPVKRIINGKSYNTTTSLLVFHTKGQDEPMDILGWGLYYPSEAELYRTRHGAFFLLKRDQHKNYHDDFGFENVIEPYTDDEALKWMELNCPEQIEDYFGEMPEAGSSEVNISLRLPKVLSDKAKKIAKSENLSLNAWLNLVIRNAISLKSNASE